MWRSWEVGCVDRCRQRGTARHLLRQSPWPQRLKSARKEGAGLRRSMARGAQARSLGVASLQLARCPSISFRSSKSGHPARATRKQPLFGMSMQFRSGLPAQTVRRQVGFGERREDSGPV